MKLSPKVKGVIFIILSALLFAFGNFWARLAGDAPVAYKTFFRNSIATLFCIYVVIKQGGKFRLENPKNFKYLMGRFVFGSIGVWGNFYALDHLLFADATMLNKTSPFFAILGSLVLVKEKIKPAQALFLVGAFAGALCIIKPTPTNMDLIPSVIGLISGFGAGTAYTFLRLLGTHGEKSGYIVFFFSLFTSLTALPVMLIQNYAIQPRQIICLLVSGLFVAAGQICITQAYHYAPAREISVYEYTQVVFSALLGFLFLYEIPDALSFLGYILICGMGVVSFLHTLRLHEQQTAPSR